MKKVSSICIAAAAAAVTLAVRFSASAAPAPELFVKHKCDLCHSVAAVGVETKKKTGEVVDISDSGSSGDIAYLKDYLQKKAPHKPTAASPSSANHPFEVKDAAVAEELARALVELKK